MDWTHTAGDQVFATPFWPLLVSAVGAAVCVWILLSARFRQVAYPGEPRGGVKATLPFLIPAALCVVGWLLGVLGSVFGSLFTARKDAWSIFPSYFLLVVVCVLLASVMAAAWFFRRPRPAPSGRHAWALVAAWALSLSGVAQAGYLSTLGEYPHLDDDWQAHVHQGQKARVAARFWSDLVRPGWTLGPPAAVDTSEVGSTTVRLEASRLLAATWLQQRFRVGQELGPAGFPLRVGNRWYYTRERSRVDSLWQGVSRSEARLTLEITGTRVHRGLRQFSVKRKSGLFWIYALDGKLYAHDGDRLRRSNKKAAHPELKIGAPGATKTYAFDLLTGSCLGVALPGKQYQIPGPCDCLASSGGNPFSVLLMVVTVGAAAPGLSDDEQVFLTRSVAGPRDAKAAAVTPHTASKPGPFARDRTDNDKVTTRDVCGALRGNKPVDMERYCVVLEPRDPSGAARLARRLREDKRVSVKVVKGAVAGRLWHGDVREDLGLRLEQVPVPAHGCPTFRCRDVLRGAPPAGVKRVFVNPAYCR